MLPVAEFTTLRDAVAELVKDGDTVAMEGFTHLIPFAAGHEIIRQGRRDLTLIRMTPDVIYDQMIGAGCARKLVFSWGGNPGVGSLHRLRDAVENGYPASIELEEHTHAGMTVAYAAGASGLPFGIARAYQSTEISQHNPQVRTITCPFTGEELAAIAAIRPDVAVIHAQHADRNGNVALWGISGSQKEAVLSAGTAIATVEEVVEHLEPMGPNYTVFPDWTITAVAVVPRGSHPSYALDFYPRDNAFYSAWDAISRSRETFDSWLAVNVFGVDDHEGYLARVDAGGGIGV